MPALRPGSTQRPLSEINVTPFVDVVLVLLIIFMVTAPMMQQGVDVNLPKTTTQNLRVKEEPLIITVKKGGVYFLANTELSEDELGAKLSAILDGVEDKGVFLRADRDANYGAVVKALAAARQAGATRLGMVTEPE